MVNFTNGTEEVLRNTILKVFGLADAIRAHQEARDVAEAPALDFWASCLFEIGEGLKQRFPDI